MTHRKRRRDGPERGAIRAGELNLEAAVGRARAGRDRVRWQGLAQACPAPCLGLTLRARARKEEQRRQSAAAWPARVCSAITYEVMDLVGGNVSIHAVSPAESSGQLRFLGACRT